VTVASSNLNVALEDSTIRQMTLHTPPEGVKGLAPEGVKGLVTRAPRAAHASPRAAAHTMASPAVCTCSLPRKAALRSGAEMVSMMPAHVACGRVS
jgi:hypothetical protein